MADNQSALVLVEQGPAFCTALDESGDSKRARRRAAAACLTGRRRRRPRRYTGSSHATVELPTM